MLPSVTIAQWILGLILVFSALGVILMRKPVHACLSFLLTLLTLATLYLQLSAEFIAVIQILVYAGAILVLFIFVMVLFQDAYQKIEEEQPKSSKIMLGIAGIAFIVALLFFAWRLIGLVSTKEALPSDFGTVQAIGKSLYVDFFFPFEAVIMLFLIAIIGALYIGKKTI